MTSNRNAALDLDALERLRADWPNGNGSRNRLIGALLVGGQLDALIQLAREVVQLREALEEIVKACPFNLDDAVEGGPHPGLIAAAALAALSRA